jgi:hypothetical protein
MGLLDGRSSKRSSSGLFPPQRLAEYDRLRQRRGVKEYEDTMSDGSDLSAYGLMKWFFGRREKK